MTTTFPVTADELLRMKDSSARYELVAGEIRMMSPAGWRHGELVFRLSLIVGDHVKRHQLGRCFGAETGFLLQRNPDTVLAPDIAFIHSEHLPDTEPQDAYWPAAPDLIVEVRSPGDRNAQVAAKVETWLAAGGLMVWDVDPATRQVTVHRPDLAPIVLETEDELDGGELLPGFCCSVGKVFEDSAS